MKAQLTGDEEAPDSGILLLMLLPHRAICAVCFVNVCDGLTSTILKNLAGAELIGFYTSSTHTKASRFGTSAPKLLLVDIGLPGL